MSSANCVILREYLPALIPIISSVFPIKRLKNSADQIKRYSEMGSPCLQPLIIDSGLDKLHKKHVYQY